MSRERLEQVREDWRRAWEEALSAWSRFTKLRQPRFCMTLEERREEGLSESFAMIRLNDHTIVIGLEEVVARGLDEFAREVLAHEIGHHVYAPADLSDNARLLARIRRALPYRESYAPMVANLYTDLLINDRLQRNAELDMAGVYRRLRDDEPDDLWAMYMRTYEVLWALRPDELVPSASVSEQVQSDAGLAARLVRVYSKQWLGGAGRFATLVLPYLMSMPEGPASVVPWMDTLQAGAGDQLPDGLAELEDGEIDGVVHPGDDPAIAGYDTGESSSAQDPNYEAQGRERIGGRKNRYREPTEYVELMKSLGVEVDARDLIVRYYRERAIPHLVPFPVRESTRATDPLPEGVETWDVGSPVHHIDWVQSMIRSPHVIPGVTTVERLYGTTEGSQPERTPVDLYLGVDCSGSMPNPEFRTSYPVVAGAVIAVSALRSGSRVKVTLSGEPGEHSSTPGFERSEREALGVLTGYLGTGYAFGVKRLQETFLEGDPEFDRAIHILIVTDSDLFRMVQDVKEGWDIMERAPLAAGGGATLVLDRTDIDYYAEPLKRLKRLGWEIHHVADQEGLVTFARAFARDRYGQGRAA